MADMGNAEVQPINIAFGRAYKAPTVLVGGQMITDATRVTVDCENGKAPKVFLELEPEAVDALELDGVVHIIREVPADPIKVTLAFLEPLDPAELDRCVLETMGLGGVTTYGEAALEVLRGWARGD
jgi:hypothetical protein